MGSISRRKYNNSSKQEQRICTVIPLSTIWPIPCLNEWMNEFIAKDP